LESTVLDAFGACSGESVGACLTDRVTASFVFVVGRVTPDDEHHGRSQAVRDARRHGLEQARQHRVATRRQIQQTRHQDTKQPEDI